MSKRRSHASVETPNLFVTQIYRITLADGLALNDELETAAYALAEDDEAGQAWCEANAYAGYTSYGSLNDLPWRFPPFAALQKGIDREVTAFAAALEFDLRGRPLSLDSLWVNILTPGGGHSGHIHPHSVISGTYYVRTPQGASELKLEDPRLPLMMAAPPRRADCANERKTFFYLKPQAGELVLWESWLRHEVLPSQAEEDRISISFNYRWGV